MSGRVEFLPEEWFNGQIHLARVIGSMALQHREIGSTYPPMLEPGEWSSILQRIGEPLMAYADLFDDFEGFVEREKAAKEAMELFANWFMYFWD